MNKDISRMPAPGELCRLGTGELCQIVCCARHAETGAPLVVYQVLSGDFGFLAAPPESFSCTPVNRETLSSQEMNTEDPAPAAETAETKESPEEAAEKAKALFLRFFDSDDLKEKRFIVRSLKGKATKVQASGMAFSLDLQPAGDVDDTLQLIDDNLSARIHYERERT